jgi:hypothetical protein
MFLIVFLATIGAMVLVGGCIVAYVHRDILFPKRKDSD